MGSKNKLKRFRENETFANVFQPSRDELVDGDYHLKGKWIKDVFKNDNPLVLELGCGKGEYTVGLAERFPDINFIGIDIKGARIWTGAKKAHLEKIPNVAFIRTWIEVVNSFFSPAEIDEIWLTFPDPQLKRSRNKKRLTAARFLNLYRKFLKDNGIIHLKTDNSILYEYTLDLARLNKLKVEFETNNLYGSEYPELVHGIKTFYEKQFIEEGLNIHYLQFRLPSGKNIMEQAEDGE